MGISIISQSGSGEGPRSRMAMPVMDGLKLVALYGNSSTTQSRKNLAAKNLPAATLVGTPTVSASRATLNMTNCFSDPTLIEPHSFTFIYSYRAVTLPTSANTDRSQQIGFGTGAVTAVYIQDNVTYRASAEFAGSVQSASLTTTQAEMQTDRLMAWVVNQGVGHTIYDLTKGTSATVTNTATRNTSGGALFIGGGSSTSKAGTMEMHSVVYHDAALTKAQIDLQAVAIRKFLFEVRGVTV